MLNFSLCVVQIKAGAARAWKPEFAHQWLVAMVTAPKRKPLLITESRKVMRVNGLVHEAYQSAAIPRGAQRTVMRELGDFLIRQPCEARVMGLN